MQEQNLTFSTTCTYPGRYFLGVSLRDIVIAYTLFFLILINLARFSGILSGTSSVGLRFIFVCVSTSVLLNGPKTLFDFRRLYAPRFPRQPYSWRKSHFRRPFVMVSGLFSLILPNWFVLTSESINQNCWKGQPRVKSCLSYHWLFSMTPSNELPVNFFEFDAYFTKLIVTLVIMSENDGNLSMAVYFFTSSIKVKTNSQVTFSYGPLHTDKQVLDDQLELMRTQDVA